MSFEEALAELETIVRKMESGQGELEASIADYSRGTALKDHCLKKLGDAKLKVEKVVKDSQGNLSLKPFEEQA
jgi:exodeoxyribonuclease VII small subunit